MLDIHYQVHDDDGERDDAAYDAFLDSIWQTFRQAPEGQELLATDANCGHWADMFLRYYFDHLGSSIPEITSRDVREVLFQLIPEKVSVEPAAAPEIIRELRAFWGFLGRAHSLPRATDIQAILNDDAVLELKNQLANSSNYGMAKSFVMRGRDAGFDMSTEEGVAAFMAAYNTSLASRPMPPMPIWMDRIGGVQHTSTKELKKRRKAQRQARKRNRR